VPGWLTFAKDIAPILAILVSLVALGFSWRSSNTARQALKISKAQEERRLRSLAVAVESFLFDRDKGSTYYLLEISVSNRADSSNAVPAVELWVNYCLDGRAFTFKAKRDFGGVVEKSRLCADPLPVPMKIEAGNVSRGWLGFVVPRAIVDLNVVEDYRVVVIDTHGNEAISGVSLARKAVIIGGESETQGA
jgi:hypothetical protein